MLIYQDSRDPLFLKYVFSKLALYPLLLLPLEDKGKLGLNVSRWVEGYEKLQKKKKKNLSFLSRRVT